jgi:hypothetical protein
MSGSPYQLSEREFTALVTGGGAAGVIIWKVIEPFWPYFDPEAALVFGLVAAVAVALLVFTAGLKNWGIGRAWFGAILLIAVVLAGAVFIGTNARNGVRQHDEACMNLQKGMLTPTGNANATAAFGALHCDFQVKEPKDPTLANRTANAGANLLANESASASDALANVHSANDAKGVVVSK